MWSLQTWESGWSLGDVSVVHPNRGWFLAWREYSLNFVIGASVVEWLKNMHLEPWNPNSVLDIHVIFCKQTLDCCKLETNLINGGFSAFFKVSRYNRYDTHLQNAVSCEQLCSCWLVVLTFVNDFLWSSFTRRYFLGLVGFFNSMFNFEFCTNACFDRPGRQNLYKTGRYFSSQSALICS